MCGLPGHGPGDLIDLSFEGDTVSVIFDAGMSRPLRLTNEEALALVVALRTLAETPGITDGDAVQRALAKVEAAAGGAVDDSDTVAVELDQPDRGCCRCCAAALVEGAGTGAALLHRRPATRRPSATVDPMRLFEMDGHVLPRGVVPQRRRHAGLPGRPHRARRDARRAGPAAGRGPTARLERRRVPAGLRAPARRAAVGRRLCLGGRLLPDRRGHRVEDGAADEPAGRGPRLGARARPRLGRAGRGAVAGAGWPSRWQRSGRAAA